MIVGREPELHAVDEFVARGSGVLAVVGEPGIGKTTVWKEAVDRARTTEATVLLARPAESEARLSFAGLADLLAEVPDEVFDTLPAPQRVGIDSALLRTRAARAPARRVVGTAFLSLLRTLTAHTRVVLAIDDLHWLDPPSAAVLAFALRRLADEPVYAIVSLRTQATENAGLLTHELQVERLELGPLSVAAFHRILVENVGKALPRPLLVRIAQASGGNPLYAIEIARMLDRAGDVDLAQLPVPASLDALVRSRIVALPDPTRAALLRASALARPGTDTVSAHDLAAAEDAGLVRVASDGRIHFVHPLFASAVYLASPSTRRRETHRALADVVSDPEERARHLALGSDHPDDDVVAELASAARLAQQRGAPDTAAELTELALRFVAPGTEAARNLQLDLAEHLYLASDFQRARAVLKDLTSAASGNLRTRALLRLAEVEYWLNGESAALAIAEEAHATADDPLERAWSLVSIAGQAGTVDLPKAAAAAREAVELLEALPDAPGELTAAALASRVRTKLFLGEGFDARAAERALKLQSSAPPTAVDERITFLLGQWLRYVDDLAQARARLIEAEQQARDEGDESSLANILLNRVIAENWAGEWTEAAQLADRMVAAFEQEGVTSRDVTLWRAYHDAHVGRVTDVRAAADRASRGEPIIDAIWNRSLGLAALASGDTQSADRHLSDAMAELDRIDFREPAVWRIDGDAIEAGVATGALERAEGWVKRFEKRAARSQIPWSLAVSARCRGLVLAAQGDLDGAAEALEVSLREHERCPVPFERARTLLVQGQILRRMKRKRQAREALGEARATFERLGSETWIARVDAELQRVAVRKAPEELSATELRIAQLAASGLSNPEIAAEVFVSRKTVEANLARAYRKLDVSSRAELGRALDRLPKSIS